MSIEPAGFVATRHEARLDLLFEQGAGLRMSAHKYVTSAVGTPKRFGDTCLPTLLKDLSRTEQGS